MGNNCLALIAIFICWSILGVGTILFLAALWRLLIFLLHVMGY